MRTTYLTGSWQPSPEAEAHDVTVFHDGKRYLTMTVKGALVDPRKGVWRTLATTRKASKGTVRGDGRYGAGGPAMFRVPARYLLDKSGKPKGRRMDFAAFVAYLLDKSGDEPWGKETRADREADAKGMLAQRRWLTEPDEL